MLKICLEKSDNLFSVVYIWLILVCKFLECTIDVILFCHFFGILLLMLKLV